LVYFHEKAAYGPLIVPHWDTFSCFLFVPNSTIAGVHLNVSITSASRQLFKQMTPVSMISKRGCNLSNLICCDFLEKITLNIIFTC